eukprot:1849231-Pleurochrysis_carterae.AAC.6
MVDTKNATASIASTVLAMPAGADGTKQLPVVAKFGCDAAVLFDSPSSGLQEKQGARLSASKSRRRKFAQIGHLLPEGTHSTAAGGDVGVDQDQAAALLDVQRTSYLQAQRARNSSASTELQTDLKGDGTPQIQCPLSARKINC